MLHRSLSRPVLVIKNNGFVIKDRITGEGFMDSFVEIVSKRALGGWVNCNLMCIEDALLFLTSGTLLS